MSSDGTIVVPKKDPLLTDSAPVNSSRVLVGTDGNLTTIDEFGTIRVYDVGASDHGTLTGLGDDDHTQYHNNTRGDARYYTKTEVNTFLDDKLDVTDPLLSATNVVNVKLNPGAGEFDNIEDALASITTNSDSQRFAIKVAAGNYFTNPLTMKPFVSIIGESPEATLITTLNANTHIITLVNNTYLSNCTLTGATAVGSAAVFFENAVEDVATLAAFLVNIKFGSNNIQIKVNSTTTSTSVYASNCRFGGTYVYNQGLVATSSSGKPARITLRDCTTTGSSVPFPTEFGYASGIGAEIALVSTSMRISLTSPSGTGVRAADGALVRILACRFVGFNQAIYSENIGVAPTITAVGIDLSSNTQDIRIDHPGTMGSYIGTYNPLKVSINPASPFFIQGKDLKIVTVAKAGGDFSSVASACDSIIDSSPTTPYLVLVGPGIYIEPTINVPMNVSVKGASINTTTITPSGPNQHAFVMSTTSEISFLNVVGDAGSVGSGYAAFYMQDCGDFVQFHKVSIYDMDIGFDNYANTAESIMYAEYCDINGDYAYAVRNRGVDGFLAKCQIENFYTYASAATGTITLYSEGPDAQLIVTAAGLKGDLIQGSGVVLSNGSSCELSAVSIADMGIVGLKTPNIGSGPVIDTNGLIFINCTQDIQIQNPGTTGSLQGAFDRNKILIDELAPISVFFADPVNGGITSTGDFYIGDSFSELVEVSDLIVNAPTMGVYSGGALSAGAGLNVNIAQGFGYLMFGTHPNHTLKRFDWVGTTLLLGANSNNYIYINSSGIVSTSATQPSSRGNILLGRAVTNDTVIEIIDASSVEGHHHGNNIDQLTRQAIGSIYDTGSIVSANNSRELAVSAGIYFFASNKFSPSGAASGFAFNTYYRDGLGSFTKGTATIVPNSTYDDSTGVLAAVPASNYTKHSLYLVGQGINEKYLFVYAQATHASLVLAESGDIPTPPTYFTDGIVLIATIIVQQGNATFSQIRDERPIIGFKASGVSATSTHGNLLGLSADDHTQYLLTNGGRALTGTLNLGTNNITNIGTLNGVTIETHASRHDFNGADPLLSAVPQTIGTVNAEGVDNTHVSRADHVHAHGNLPGGSSHAAATISVNGYMSAVDKLKLDGIATAATANSSDAFLLARTNHTGTQISSTISDFDTASDARITLQKGVANGLATLDAGIKIPTAQHGNYSDGTHHDAATTSVNGFMSSVDKLKLDGVATGATVYTDEQAQDAVGTILTDSSSVDLSYNDGANTISAVVLPAGVDHDALLNFSTNKHIDHSTVSINAGTGLTGGGDITTSRTLNLANTAVTAASYGTTTQTPTIVIDAQGRITSAANTTIQIAQSQVTDLTTDLAGKQATGNYITGLTGDVVASGPGSVAATLANTAVSAGSYLAPDLTIDSKGRITAATPSRYSYRMTATQSSSLIIFGAATQLTSVSLPIGNYRFYSTAIFQTVATTTGIGLRLGTGTAVISPCLIKWNIRRATSNTASSNFEYDQLASTTDLPSDAVPVANTNVLATAQGTFSVTTAGTVALQFRSEVVASAVTLGIGSIIVIEVL